MYEKYGNVGAHAAPHLATAVHPFQDREVAKAKEERETGRAAERERAKVAEEVAVKLEMELTQVWMGVEFSLKRC